MGQRKIRVDELIRREISQLLHTRYQSESVSITVQEVDVSPNLRSAKVYYSILGDYLEIDHARRFFAEKKSELRQLVGKSVVLKYLPHFEFIYDEAMERGARLNTILDDLGLAGERSLESGAADPREFDQNSRLES